MVIRIEPYTSKHTDTWNIFISASKNGTFLFDRRYMDYHQDRFADHSLMVYEGEVLVAVFPANRVGDALYSHQGLTYGGVVTDKHMRADMMLEIFDALGSYARTQSIQAISYKAIPHIYHSYPSEEDLYALFRAGAQIVRTDVSTAILLSDPWPLHQSKKSGASRAQKAGLALQASDDFDAFFAMAQTRLMERYNTAPVHTAAEMRLLASRFPDNIKLFGVYFDAAMVAGAVVYITHQVIHTQYIASTEEGRDMRAVDYLIAHLIKTLPGKQAYFDFGISNEEQGKILNVGLAKQKEEFGGRSIVHQTYLWNL